MISSNPYCGLCKKTTRIWHRFNNDDQSEHLPGSHDESFVFDLQLMSQMRWFHKLSSVILIILAHYWDFELNCQVCCAHHCISDDLNKSNEQMTHCFDFVRYSILIIGLLTIKHFCTLTNVSLPLSLSETIMIERTPGCASSATKQTSPHSYRQRWKSMQKCLPIQLDDWLCQWGSWSWNNPT